MKTKIKILGLIFTVIAMTAFIAACSNPAGVDDNWYSGGGGGNGGGGGAGGGGSAGGEDVTGTPSIGHNLELTGQVWIYDLMAYDFIQFTGNRSDIKGYLHSFSNSGSVENGTGTITGGELSFNMGIPTELLPSYTISSFTMFAETLSPVETQFNILLGFKTEFSETSALYKRTSSGTHYVDYTDVFEHYYFLYVDQDATISSLGGYNESSYSGITYFFKYEPYTINLDAGWNIIRIRDETVQTSTHGGQTSSVSLANPGDAKWMMAPPPPKP